MANECTIILLGNQLCQSSDKNRFGHLLSYLSGLTRLTLMMETDYILKTLVSIFAVMQLITT
jgi:hypothetical protein